MGTNQWAEKPYVDPQENDKAMIRFISNMKRLREVYNKQRLVVVVAPEKDYVINYMFYGHNRYGGIDESLEYLKAELAKVDIKLVFNCSLKGLNKYINLNDFEYFDSHLTGANYIQIFCRICEAFDLNHNEIHSQMTMTDDEVYGDLRGKFSDYPLASRRTFRPYYPYAITSLTDGINSFGSPLGKTWQRLVNDNPLVEGDVLILGDSHSSIYNERRLTYLASGVFCRTDFFWNPCGVRKEVPETAANYAILEISCRFLF
jgi:hypothetical protein